MSANVCLSCDLAWPTGTEFADCCDCGGPTEYQSAAKREFTFEEARRRAAFRDFYAQHDQVREHRGDPSPEALGALEARRELAQIRQLEAAL